ncbi:efflux transporter outer membrane subunit [Sulfurimonas paralvinellae]|uniref:TolC family protein n=1 Tax=Sulfurimonas paralvinellae TaxID=317658 RepID=A0A7M1B7J9_9BACT|nr:TolC family protein [Sulfurimonas paralvinellae]QOP45625.1 TolC family protein [Sulfurimonas paralvinellae]
MKAIKTSLIFTIFIISLLLSGCSVLGPDFKGTEPQKFPTDWDANKTKKDANLEKWWELFHDDTLNTLVSKMYEQNLDLRSAGLRILQARAALGISQGLTYPQVQTLSGSLAGVRNAGNSFQTAGVNFDLAWEMDIWGKYARNIESSEATLYASVASYNDTLVSLIAEVARNYINYTTASERINFAKRNIELQERVTKMTEVQFNAGNVSELDMQQSKTQLYTTRSLLPSLELAKIKSRNAIAVLLGILPQDVDAILKKNKEGSIPEINIDNTFKVDASLIQRRPDLQVAELQAKAQNARIGSSEAELYPHFSLFGTIGYNTNNAGNNWVSAGDAIGISAGPSFSWNILQYDRIKNQVRIQDAKFQESLLNYNKKVFRAIQEVSNALNGYKLTKEQLQLNAKTIEATKRAYELSATQYENGLVTYQRLLSTVENLTKTEDSYAIIEGNIALEAIALYKALGGGWQIHTSKSYLNEKDKESLKLRGVDWGDYLEAEDE